MRYLITHHKSSHLLIYRIQINVQKQNIPTVDDLNSKIVHQLWIYKIEIKIVLNFLKFLKHTYFWIPQYNNGTV